MIFIMHFLTLVFVLMTYTHTQYNFIKTKDDGIEDDADEDDEKEL